MRGTKNPVQKAQTIESAIELLDICDMLAAFYRELQQLRSLQQGLSMNGNEHVQEMPAPPLNSVRAVGIEKLPPVHGSDTRYEGAG
jgi:hypothetical protein